MLAIACALALAAAPVQSSGGRQEGAEKAGSGEAAADELDALFDDGLDALLAGTAPEDGPGETSWFDEWRGFFELRPRWYANDRNRGRNDEQLVVEGEVELQKRLTDATSLYLRPRLFLDLADSDLYRVDPLEAHVTWEEGAWDVRAGLFVENWGVVDTYNPVDVLNRRDFATDALNPRRLGELGVRVRRSFGGAGVFGQPAVSLYAIPLFQETRFPTDDQRFGFGSPALPFDEDGGFEPDGGEQAFFAVRAQSTLETAPVNADLQAVVAYGPDRNPQFAPLAGALRPVYHGARTIGVGARAVPNEDFAGALLASLTLKVELTHSELFEFDGAPLPAPDDYTVLVVGVDRVFPNVFTERDQITLTLEYAHEESSGGNLLRPFGDDLIGRAFWEANDFARQSLELRGLVDLEVDEQIVELVYERQLRSIHEDLQLIVTGQLFETADPGRSPFAIYPDNSSLAVGLRFDF